MQKRIPVNGQPRVGHRAFAKRPYERMLPVAFDPERHHRRTIRMPAYDYSAEAVYFVTICTKGRKLLFGNVKNGGMAMNELGWFVWEEWERSAEMRKEVQVGAFVVMPNHLHSIVTTNPEKISTAFALDRKSFNASTRVNAPVRLQPRSLGSFIGGYKAATTRHYNRLIGTADTPLWQRNYYERVVRSETAMEKIWAYIETNPLQWTTDRENPDQEGENAIETWFYPAADTRS